MLLEIEYVRVCLTIEHQRANVAEARRVMKSSVKFADVRVQKWREFSIQI